MCCRVVVIRQVRRLTCDDCLYDCNCNWFLINVKATELLFFSSCSFLNVVKNVVIISRFFFKF